MPTPRRNKPTPGTMAGPQGRYFHKQVEGITRSSATEDQEEKAVTYIARHRRDQGDFKYLVDALGLDAMVKHLREERDS